MIDPIAAVIAYLKADSGLDALVDGRVAVKHRYGEKWPVGETGLAVRADGGDPDVYVPEQRPRLELRIYGSSTVAVIKVYLELVRLSRATSRERVTLDGDDAFLQWLLPGSGFSMLYDDEVGMDMGMVFFDACVGELGI